MSSCCSSLTSLFPHPCLASYSKIHSRLNFATTMYYKRDIRFITHLLIHVKFWFLWTCNQYPVPVAWWIRFHDYYYRTRENVFNKYRKTHVPLQMTHLWFSTFVAFVLLLTSSCTIQATNDERKDNNCNTIKRPNNGKHYSLNCVGP